jgi:hypothetical protein
MQGDTPEAERGVLEVRRSECRGEPTPQMGLFQQPAPDAIFAPNLLESRSKTAVLTNHQSVQINKII